MADLATIFSQTTSTYQRPEDLDFPVSKIRFFIDILWQAVTLRQLSEEQKVTLKELIDLLNLLDEHKHEPQKELISAMLPSIAPLLAKMPTLGLTGTHVFTHLVPIYQLYLPSIEKMVKDAHPFTLEETMLYYELTIFDHLFLVHIFEQETDQNMIELLLTIKAVILINALVYDYQQHVNGRSISFFTFLMRGGMAADKLSGFLLEAVEYVCNQTKLTVQNTNCIETLEFLKAKLLGTTTQTVATETEGEVKEESALTQAFDPATPTAQADQIFADATPLTTEDDTPVTAEPMVTPVAEVTAPTPVLAVDPTAMPETPMPTESPVTTVESVEVTQAAIPSETTTPVVETVTPIEVASPVTQPMTEPVVAPEPLVEVPTITETPIAMPTEVIQTQPPTSEPAMTMPETTQPIATTTVESMITPAPVIGVTTEPSINEVTMPTVSTPVDMDTTPVAPAATMPVNTSPLAEDPQIKAA